MFTFSSIKILANSSWRASYIKPVNAHNQDDSNFRIGDHFQIISKIDQSKSDYLFPSRATLNSWRYLSNIAAE